jgi:hypothetical protein
MKHIRTNRLHLSTYARIAMVIFLTLANDAVMTAPASASVTADKGVNAAGIAAAANSSRPDVHLVTKGIFLGA